MGQTATPNMFQFLLEINQSITRELFLCFFMQIRDRNSSCQNRIVSMIGGHCGCCFCSQIIQLASGDTDVQSVDYLKCYRHLNGDMTRTKIQQLTTSMQSKLTYQTFLYG